MGDFFNEIRNTAGNIPILLIGNKSDLKESVGEVVKRDKIIQMVNQYNLFEYVETSALENVNVNLLFNRLSTCALLELKPRLGEVVDADHFRFKVLLAGAAAVGKTSLIKTFVKKEFSHDYKITVGLDFMTREFEIPSDDLPNEIHEMIQKAIEIENKNKKHRADLEAKLEAPSEPIETPLANPTSKVDIKSVLSNTYIYFALILIFGVLIATLFIHAIFNL